MIWINCTGGGFPDLKRRLAENGMDSRCAAGPETTPLRDRSWRPASCSSPLLFRSSFLSFPPSLRVLGALRVEKSVLGFSTRADSLRQLRQRLALDAMPTSEAEDIVIDAGGAQP